jgi:hypothetical protein
MPSCGRGLTKDRNRKNENSVTKVPSIQEWPDGICGCIDESDPNVFPAGYL